MKSFYPFDEITAIQIAGRDRLKWLNNLVTNDVRKVSESHSVECFVTDVKGRTLSHGIVIDNLESFIYFAWGADQANRLLTHWDRYIIREDVALTDVSSNWKWGFIHRNHRPFPISENVREIEAGMMGNDWLLIRFEEEDAIGPIVSDSGQANSETEDYEFNALRIKNRWPLIGMDFDEKNLPQELDRDAAAISFQKGCYLGQETVARLDALGQVQKKLVLLKLDCDDRQKLDGLGHGTVLTQGNQEAGTITSWSRDTEDSPTDQPTISIVALAYVRRAYFAIGTELECGGMQAIVGPCMVL